MARGPSPARLRAGVVKRSLQIAGHATSVSLEEPFWQALRAMAAERGMTPAVLIGEIDRARGPANLSSALRVAALDWALAGRSAGRATDAFDKRADAAQGNRATEGEG
jgi:predicted DNA-binding ribbon-helix-helix protein